MVEGNNTTKPTTTITTTQSIPKLKNYIRGRFQAPVNEQYIDGLNPATKQIFYLVPDSDDSDVEKAVQAGLQAFPTWSKLTRSQRSEWLHRLANAIETKKLEFAIAESKDQGKTIKQALELEIPRCVTNLKYFADLIKNVYETAADFEGGSMARSVTRHEPIGVVGVIVPWNLPLYLLTWKIAPALAMGNCVVAKPSEVTSLTAHMLAELAHEIAFPPGVLNVVFGKGSSTGKALVIHPQVHAISFTGGTVTGRIISELAGRQGKKLALELGGKNPGIIFSDCGDLEKVVNACVKAAFTNQGEVCLCTSRLYVERNIYERFLNLFKQKASSLQIGDPLNEKTDIGALVSAQHLEKVMSYINLAYQEQVEVFSTTTQLSREGFFCPPTIITNLKNHQSRLIQEEIFGPVVVVWPFDSEEEVVQLANDTQYGLAAAIWTGDGRRGERLARSIRAGQVWINCWMVRDLSMPFGGMKASGHGREGGHYALTFFSDIKTITTAL